MNASLDPPYWIATMIERAEIESNLNQNQKTNAQNGLNLTFATKKN